MVAILGTGLIGGSLGLALSGNGYSVTGYDPDPGTRVLAEERGAVARAEESPAAAVRGAELIVLAGPISSTGELMAAIRPHVGDDTVVTDVGSAKEQVVKLGERFLGSSFLGGHPMAGSEQHGIEAADARLFQDAFWILTPTADSRSSAYGAVADMAAAAGAKPIAVEPRVHDHLMARLSHVPQLAASAVVQMAASAGDEEALLGLAAGGFRDVTRIAASDPDMWVAVIRANRQAVQEGLWTLGERLAGLGEMIETERWDDVHTFLSSARTSRRELFAKPEYTGDPVKISLYIPDRPGVLAEVTTVAGELGANIEDLVIYHSTEGGRGRLDLVISGAVPAQGLAQRLEVLGYHVDTGVGGL